MLTNPLDEALATFLASPVMIIIGSRDSIARPEIARGCGAIADRKRGVVEIVFSAWLWPATLRNLQGGGPCAVTFARPSDYVTYQVKGEALPVAPAPPHLAAAAGYERDIRAVFAGLGLARHLVDLWISWREPAVLSLRVDEVFVQTPGPRAGLPR